MSNQSGAHNLTPQEQQAISKSKVRVCVTYVATLFVFGVSTVLIFWFMLGKEDGADKALTVFNTILPVATGIVTYWFATRSNRKSDAQGDLGDSGESPAKKHLGSPSSDP